MAKLNPGLDRAGEDRRGRRGEVPARRSEFPRVPRFHVYDQSGNEVSIGSIDWHDVGPGNFPHTLRQDRGRKTPWGPVKLDFPNDYSVYLHGTNQRAVR